MKLSELSTRTVHQLSDAKQTLSTAESCTGGLLAKLITDVPGSSQIFIGGVVSYSNAMKMKWLGVAPGTIDRFGAVSQETVAEMLTGIIRETGSDLAVAVSGVAGPTGGTVEKPVGTVIIGWQGRDFKQIENYHFKGNRAEIRNHTAEIVFQRLMELL